MTPRVISTEDAKAYLGGLHPATLGVRPVTRGRWDTVAINAALDRIANIAPQSAPVAGAGEDGQDELEALAQRIRDAARRA